MSTMLYVTVALGALATALFIGGYVRGIVHAIADHRNPQQAEPRDVEEKRYGILVGGAVLAASVIIALVGVNSNWMYAGPLLAIVTAAMNGLAFFYDKEPQA